MTESPQEAAGGTRSTLQQASEQAMSWLLDEAAPLWSSRGRTTSGLFAERMTLTGEPDSEYFRTFVQARHIFSFVQIGRMGWAGPWRELVAETTETLIRQAKRSDGYFVHSLDEEANPIDERADLYDQAFVLLALGTVGGALGRTDWFDEAEELLDRLEANLSHPLGGFHEGEIVDPRLRRQNPHMHLLEAFLALGEASGRQRFNDAASSLATLASEKFMDPSTGALLEFFTDGLQPAFGVEGRIAEPGHCFEWAWMFERLSTAGWEAGARVADRLTGFARAVGMDSKRNVAINEVLTDGTPRHLTARLWPQTERLKSAVVRFKRLDSEVEVEEMISAAHGLRQYLQVEIPGLWRDRLREDGRWIEEPAPGSSLYHVTCAYSELLSIRDRVDTADDIGSSAPSQLR